MKTEIIQALTDIQVVQHGEFTLKSGETSNLYIDMRRIISYPKVLKLVSQALQQKLETLATPELICGVPYAALPLASVVSIDADIPMIMYRKETKTHGTKKQVEGDYQQGQSCIIIEDVITTGGSLIAVADRLREHGLKVEQVLAVVNRGGDASIAALKQHGLNLQALIGLEDLAN